MFVSMFCFFLTGGLLGFLLGKSTFETNKPASISISIECHENEFFAYRNGKYYLNKSKSYESLITELKTQFPEHLIYITEPGEKS